MIQNKKEELDTIMLNIPKDVEHAKDKYLIAGELMVQLKMINESEKENIPLIVKTHQDSLKFRLSRAIDRNRPKK